MEFPIMLTRRALVGTMSAAAAISMEEVRAVHAATPRDVAVMAKQIDDIVSLDPHESFEASGNEIIGNCYQVLVTPDRTDPAVLRGELAESWQVAEDGLTYTFRLRPDARFATGVPVTAEDAAFSLQRAVMLDKAPASILGQFGFTRDNAAERIRAEGDRMLVLRLAERKAPSFLLYCLSATVGSIVEKMVVLAHQQGSDLGNAWLKGSSAGSGAWMVRSWRPSESVALDASPAAENPIRRLLVRHVADPAAQLLLVRGGEVDIARNLSADQLNALDSTGGYTVSAQGRGMLMYVAMNQQHAELAQPGVRQAIKWALDYEAIQRTIVPTTYRVQQAFLPQGFPAASSETPFHKDVARAKALLAEAGLASGFEVVMDHSSASPHSDIAQAVQADLGQVGIQVRLLAAETRQVITKTRARQHQLALLTWGSDYFDPEANAGTFCVNTDNRPEARDRTLAWRSAWQDQRLTEQAMAAVVETDTNRRLALYQQMQRDHMERSPFAIMLQQTDTAVLRPGVSGFEIAPAGRPVRYAGIRKA